MANRVYLAECDRFGEWMVVEKVYNVRTLCTFCHPKNKEEAEKWCRILND